MVVDHFVVVKIYIYESGDSWVMYFRAGGID